MSFVFLRQEKPWFRPYNQKNWNPAKPSLFFSQGQNRKAEDEFVGHRPWRPLGGQRSRSFASTRRILKKIPAQPSHRPEWDPETKWTTTKSVSTTWRKWLLKKCKDQTHKPITTTIWTLRTWETQWKWTTLTRMQRPWLSAPTQKGTLVKGQKLKTWIMSELNRTLSVSWSAESQSG